MDDRDAPVAPRGVPLDGAPRLGRLPARGGRGRLFRPLLRRRLGTRAADRAAVRRRCSPRCADGIVGPFSISKLKVFVSKHFFSYRYDYREEWLRFTRTLSAESSAQSVQERAIMALADLVESPGGALWLRRRGAGFRAGRALEHAGVDARGACRRAARDVPRAHRMDRRPRRVARRTRRAMRALPLPPGSRRFPSRLARRSADVGRASSSASSCWRRRARRSSSTGRCATC